MSNVGIGVVKSGNNNGISASRVSQKDIIKMHNGMVLANMGMLISY